MTMKMSDFYIGESAVPGGFGEVYVLKAPPRADSSGGGENFLGAVLERLVTDGDRFPVPRFFTDPPRVVYDALANMTTIVKPIEDVQTLAGFSSTIDRQSGLKVSLGFDEVPNIPLKLGVKLDMSRVLSVTATFTDPVVEYIRLGRLQRLFTFLDGDADRLWKHLDREYICDTVVLVSKYAVTVQQEGDISAELEASLEAAVAGVKGGLTIAYSRTDKNSFSLTIDAASPYLYALGVRRWTEIDPN